MIKLSLELPVEVFSSLKKSPDEFVEVLRLAAAIHWYQKGAMSQENAAGIARIGPDELFDGVSA